MIVTYTTMSYHEDNFFASEFSVKVTVYFVASVLSSLL